MLTAASTRITYGILTRLTFANGSVIGNEETGKKNCRCQLYQIVFTLQVNSLSFSDISHLDSGKTRREINPTCTKIEDKCSKPSFYYYNSQPLAKNRNK